MHRQLRPGDDSRYIHLNLDPFVAQHIDPETDIADLSLNSFVNAVLAGAIAKGTLHSLVQHAVEANLVAVSRKPRTRRWVTNGRGAHTLGEYTMHRVGRGSRVEKDGNGWYVEGPGLDERVFVGRTRREAFPEADSLVDRTIKRLQTAREEHEAAS